MGIAALLQGGWYLLDRGDPTLALWLAGLLAIACGLALLVGFLTPVAGIIVGLGAAGAAFSVFQFSAPNLFESKLAAIFAVAITVAVACLGPGALSVDAVLFGRREIIIPRKES